MNAREKLNIVFVVIALLLAVFAGCTSQSWSVFLVFVVVGIAIGLSLGGIRP